MFGFSASKDVAPRRKVVRPNRKCRKGSFKKGLCMTEDGEDFDTIPHQFHKRVWSGT